MNAERLHVVALTLKKELSERNLVSTLQSLVNACQSIGQQSNATTQQNLVSARESFYASATDTPSDSFTPAWRQILIEMGGDQQFGKNLKQRVQQILAENQMTPLVAYQKLQEILASLQTFRDALDQLTAAAAHFHIGSEKLAPGEAEIALLIPRDAVDDKLHDFAGELDKMEFILNTFSEVATGHTDDLKIRTVSSSGLMLFLAASPLFGAMVAKVVDFIVGQYKKILEIKKLQLEIARLELPDEITEKTKEHANTLMEAEIAKFTAEIISEYPKGDDDGRKNELTTKVRLSLDMIANRIDRGFNFEVRIEPPTPPAKEGGEDKEVRKAVQTIQAASANMHYLKLEGPPILALPEKAGSDTGEAKPSEDVRRRKKAGAKKEDAK
jgi:hypothetical protein